MLRPYKVKGNPQSRRQPTKSKATAWEGGRNSGPELTIA
jgi:hypothetical protein